MKFRKNYEFHKVERERESFAKWFGLISHSLSARAQHYGRRFRSANLSDQIQLERCGRVWAIKNGTQWQCRLSWKSKVNTPFLERKRERKRKRARWTITNLGNTAVFASRARHCRTLVKAIALRLVYGMCVWRPGSMNGCSLVVQHCVASDHWTRTGPSSGQP